MLEWVHFRDICVSTHAETCKRFFPGAFRTSPLKEYRHRAMGDIYESIAEYRHYVTWLGATELTPE